MIEEKNNNRTGLEIAVIGMAGRFPGARNIGEFWENLKNGVESITFLTNKELTEAGVDPRLFNDPNYVKTKGGVLDDVEYFDAFFFDYIPGEAEVMDPQVRIFHECAWAALEDAGYNPDDYDGLIALYAGASSNFYWEGLTLLTGAGDTVDPFSASHLKNKDYLCPLVSYKLNLKGPSITLSTACSTSLVAVDQACRGLLTGIFDMALTGGVSIGVSPKIGYMYREGIVNSPDGHCRAFDARAQGTTDGEGVCIVVLKRLEDAIENGDHIYCVVKGFAINNDGIRKAGFTAPSIEAQADVIRAAHQMAEVEPESILYIETHGTGTPIGDPIEIEALTLAFNVEKKNYCGIGSVKTNIGHLDAAAGAASFIKAVLVLKHKLIPPSLNFKNPNPAIDFKSSPFYVNTEPKELKNDRHPVRVGVSSLGIGGTNAHVILEDAPEMGNSSESRKWQLILLSAKTKSALAGASENFTDYLKNNPGINLANAAYTLQIGRRTFKHRKMLVCSTTNEAIKALLTGDPETIKTFISKEDERYVVFMFSGQGSQYVNMGLDLYKTEAVFRQQMDRCFDILASLMGYDIKKIIYPDPGDRHADSLEQINQTEITQPLIFAFEYALARLLMNWGIKPHAMIGHSIGEYVAACLSGVFSLEDAFMLVTFRGKLMQHMPPGAMLSIALPEEKLTPLLNEEISLAAVNSSSRCVVSGSYETIDRFVKKLKEKGIDCSRLHTSHAFHSKMMDPILTPFEKKVKEVKLNEPKIPYISNVTGYWISGEHAVNPGYWTRHLRETVHFSDGLKELLKEKNSLFLEVGPGKTLCAFVRQHNDKKPGQFVIDFVRHPKKKVSDDYYLLNKIGQLWLYGIKIDWTAFYSEEKRYRIPLPTYSFDRQKFWIDGDPFKIGAELLSKNSIVKNPEIANWFYVPIWEQSIFNFPDPLEIKSQFNWLVFIDEMGFGNQLIKRLEQKGQHVTTVKVGTEFVNENKGSYIINPGQGNDYDKIFSDLRKMNRIPDQILHLWNIGKLNGDGPTLEGLDKFQDIGLYSMLNIVQAVGRHMITNDIRFTVVTSNMHKVTGKEMLHPEKATLLGAVKIIPLEYININCRSIDVIIPGAGSWDEDELPDHLLAECVSNWPENVIAYRGVHRWVQVMKPFPLEQRGAPSQHLRVRGAYIITGGFGGMGFTLAEHLAKSLKARLLLIGRSFFPAREEWTDWLNNHDWQDTVSLKIRKIQELEEQGAEVMVACADVADYNRMREVIVQAKKRFGRINGVLHTAGLADYEGAIQRRSREMTEKVMAPKVRGTLVLDTILDDEKMDVFVLFSSLGNILYEGKFGQVAYNAANEFLECFAAYKAFTSSTFTLAINWNDWLEVGMSVEAVQREHNGDMDDIDIESAFGDAILPSEGIDVFRRILENKLHRVTVSSRDLIARIEHMNRPGNRETNLLKKTNAMDSSRDLNQRPELSTEYVAPNDEIEQTLAEIFKKFFGIEKIGIYDDFFELGGDSLKALTVSSRIHQVLNVEVTLPVFFDCPTIAGLAKYICNTNKSESVAIMPTEEKEYYPLSSAQKRFYILQQIDLNTTVYNMPKIIVLNDSLDVKALEDVFKNLIERHESLRTSFEVIEGQPVQRVHLYDEINFEVELYGQLSLVNDHSSLLIEDMIRDFVRSFNLTRAPSFRVGLIKNKKGRHVLMIDMHHTIADGISHTILEQDFISLYKGKELPPLRIQYKDYSQWQNSEKEREAVKQQEAYWLKEFAGEIPVLNMPTDYPRPAIQSFEGSSINFIIESEETKALKKLALKEEASLFMVLLAIYNVWLAKISGQEDIVVGVPLAGRNYSDLEKMIGDFLKTLALRNFPTGQKTFKEFLIEVRKRTLLSFENQDYCFEDLVEKLEIQRDMSRNPLFDVVLNFHNYEVREVHSKEEDVPQKVESEPNQKQGKYEHNISPNDMTLYIEEMGENMFLTLEYCTKLFKKKKLERFITHFKKIISTVIENNEIKLEDMKMSHHLIETECEIVPEVLEDFEF